MKTLQTLLAISLIALLAGCEKPYVSVLKQSIEEPFEGRASVVKITADMPEQGRRVSVDFDAILRTNEPLFERLDPTEEELVVFNLISKLSQATIINDTTQAKLKEAIELQEDIIFLEEITPMGSKFDMNGTARMRERLGEWRVEDIEIEEITELEGSPVEEIAVNADWINVDTRSGRKTYEEYLDSIEDQKELLEAAWKLYEEENAKRVQQRIEQEKEEAAERDRQAAKQVAEAARIEAEKAKAEEEKLNAYLTEIFRTLEMNWVGTWTSQHARNHMGLVFTDFTKFPNGRVDFEGVVLDPTKPQIRKPFVGTMTHYDQSQQRAPVMEIRAGRGRGWPIETQGRYRNEINENLDQRGIRDTTMALCAMDVAWNANLTVGIGENPRIYGNIRIQDSPSFDPTSSRDISIQFEPTDGDFHNFTNSQQQQPNVTQSSISPNPSLDEVERILTTTGLTNELSLILRTISDQAEVYNIKILEAFRAGNTEKMREHLLALEKAYPASVQSLTWVMSIQKEQGNLPAAKQVYDFLQMYPLNDDQANLIDSILSSN